MSSLDPISDWIALARQSDYSCQSLAKICGVSPSQLQRYFNAVFLCTPQVWLNEVRIWHAAKLLCTSTLSVKQVATQLHFTDSSHMDHNFKSHFGCTPKQFVCIYKVRQSSEIVKFHSICGSLYDPKFLSLPPWEKAERVLGQRIKSYLSVNIRKTSMPQPNPGD